MTAFAAVRDDLLDESGLPSTALAASGSRPETDNAVDRTPGRGEIHRDDR